MIITRTPFRVSFAGGGSDLPAFYERHDGCALSASINKYMYIVVHPAFNRDTTTIKYTRTAAVFCFFCEEENQKRLRSALNQLVELPFDIENGGTKVVYVGNKDWG